MGRYRSEVVKQARAWLGCNEYDGSHKQIIDCYNSHKPYARGFKMDYKTAWCSCFVSAVAIKLGYTDIIPTEVGCGPHIELFKKLGIWVEADNYVPKPSDIILFDWEDDGVGDNTGYPNHIAYVEKVENGKITTIEGNYNNAVKRRVLAVNGQYIRGYAVPKYDDEVSSPVDPTPDPVKPTPNPVKITVKEWQEAAIADGFKFPMYGADGAWGAECRSVASIAVVKKRLTYKYKNLTKLVQRAVGATVDGLCGKNTDAAIREYQRKNGLTADGKVGLNTWRKILGV